MLPAIDPKECSVDPRRFIGAHECDEAGHVLRCGQAPHRIPHGPCSLHLCKHFCYIRHPQYAGNLLILVGIFLSTGSLWIGDNIVLLFFYYDCSANAEEQSLAQKFGEYNRYCATTGRYLPDLSKS